jgi:membrane-associated protease RseP (regulator of RpoE activity)
MRNLLMLPVLLILLAMPMSADEDYAPQGTPMLGVVMSPLRPSVIRASGLDAYHGVMVQSVFPDSAAATMGLKPDDVILWVDGLLIRSMTDQRNAMGATQVGRMVDVVVIRDGQPVRRQAVVQPWPASIPYDVLDVDGEARLRDYQQKRLHLDRSQAEAQVAIWKKQLFEETADPPRGAGPGF